MAFLTTWFGKWAIGRSFKALPIKYIIYLIIGCLIVANFIYIDHLRNQNETNDNLIDSQSQTIKSKDDEINSKNSIIKSKDLVIEQLKTEALNNSKINELSNRQTAIVNTVTKRVIAKKKTILDKLDKNVSVIAENKEIKEADKPNLISAARIDALYEAYASGEVELIVIKE